MWKRALLILFLWAFSARSRCDLPPVRGLCLPAPSEGRTAEFIRFIEEELAPRSVNVLLLRVDYGFQYRSRPEMADPGGLSRERAKQLAEVCRKQQIRLIPLVNLLGHQSWQSSCGKLLQAHPEFDETPEVKFPAKYAWPNPDRLYCKSYCPRHPQVHEVVFDLIDEVCDAFGAEAFHAGMDEVFYLGEEQCPRCRGRNKAEIFAAEVAALHHHLKKSGRGLWIWGDRLLDGKSTGLGEWEASFNETAPAVDLIPRDVVICDWHYERASPTAAYFALKGLDVVSCAWKNPDCAAAQVASVALFRENSPPELRRRFLGVAETVWNGTGSFLDEFYGRKTPSEKKPSHTEVKCFLRMFDELSKAKSP